MTLNHDYVDKLYKNGEIVTSYIHADFLLSHEGIPHTFQLRAHRAGLAGGMINNTQTS